VHPGDAQRLNPAAPAGRFAWGLTGSGHLLPESLQLAARLPHVDLFLSAAAEEILPMYGLRIDALRERFRVFTDRSHSAVPVGFLYRERYHTLVIAPATSNTVAKCALGISDTLPTNMFAQAGKLGLASIVMACDTEPVVVTRAPREWVTLRPRAIEFDNVRRLRAFAECSVACSVPELEAALDERLRTLSLAWNASCS
jgi:flavoprotein